jgi:hypothetical protein
MRRASLLLALIIAQPLTARCRVGFGPARHGRFFRVRRGRMRAYGRQGAGCAVRMSAVRPRRAPLPRATLLRAWKSAQWSIRKKRPASSVMKGIPVSCAELRSEVPWFSSSGGGAGATNCPTSRIWAASEGSAELSLSFEVRVHLIGRGKAKCLPIDSDPLCAPPSISMLMYRRLAGNYVLSARLSSNGRRSDDHVCN